MPDDVLFDVKGLCQELKVALNAPGHLTPAARAGFILRMNCAMEALEGFVAKAAQDTKKLEDLNRRLSQAYEIIEKSDVVVIEWTLELDVPTKFMTENIRQYGYTPEDFYTGHLSDYWDFIHPDDRESARKLVYSMREQHATEYKHRYRVVCADGSIRWVEENTLLEYDKAGKPIRERGILYDITNIKTIDDRIRYLSYHDKLTGLYNRAWFDEQLKEFEAECRYPFTIIIGDMNGLKVANDLFGHRAGDDLLVATAEVLRKSCRDSDIICRLGGDEFVILLPAAAEAVAKEVCRRIRQHCQSLQLKPINPSIALGYATRYDNDEPVEKLIKEADDRMYRNKLNSASSMRSSLILSLRANLEDKTMEGREHSERIKANCLLLGQRLGLGEELMDKLAIAAVMHDIGKIGIDDTLLAKPGPLSAEEWQAMRKHSEIGYGILGSAANMQPIAQYVLHHHEHWDGSGYPKGLKGEAIPQLSRIIALADAWEVMRFSSIYHPVRSVEQALAELRRLSGRQFDPVLVELFAVLVEQGEIAD